MKQIPNQKESERTEMMKGKRIMSLAVLALIVSFVVSATPIVWVQGETPVFLEYYVPMRDGVHLYTRVYLPNATVWGPGPYPAIVQRTPYGIGTPGVPPTTWPTEPLHGYAYVYQDTRGRYYSEGVDRLFYDEGPDGYDTIEWVANQSWCNGKVGISGGSALGITTYLAAGERPPHLVAALAEVASANLYNDIVFEGGAFRADAFMWAYMQTYVGLSTSHLQTVVPPGVNISTCFTNLYNSLFDMATHTSTVAPVRAVDSATWMHLPLKGGNPSVSILQPFGDEMLSHPSQDAFRDKLNVLENIDIPILNVGGWYDFFSKGTIDAFVALQSKGNHSMLFMAPGTHGNLGALPYDPYYAWFDYWLKGVDTGIMHEPPVAYYMLGANEWRNATQWPPTGINYTNYYLHDGRVLSTDPCAVGETPQSYLYDPMNPVLTWGGRNLGLPAGPEDQRSVEAGRNDILIYKTDTLTGDVEIAGPIKVCLSASSNCTDTDFTAKLIDIYPNGSKILVLDNIIRARYRESMSAPVLMEPGHIYEFNITLGDIGQVFKAGHRIQVDISSSNFPKYDRNLNSGGSLYNETAEDIKIANNTIYHDSVNPSYIVLPVTAVRAPPAYPRGFVLPPSSTHTKVTLEDFAKLKLIYSKVYPYTCPPYDVNNPATYYNLPNPATGVVEHLRPDIGGHGKVDFGDVALEKLIYSGHPPPP